MEPEGSLPHSQALANIMLVEQIIVLTGLEAWKQESMKEKENKEQKKKDRKMEMVGKRCYIY